jgi:hypothetical protein
MCRARCPACASADATFLRGENKGRIRRIALKNFQEEKSLEIGRAATWLSPSAEGLLVTIDRGEVWVIDPETLAVKKRWSVPTTRRVVSAPALATAYAQTPDDSLTILDLKNGQTRQYQRFDLRDGGFTNLIASPDGKYLFAQGGMEQLIRYRIDGTKVSVMDRTERIAQNGQSVCVSQDGVRLSAVGRQQLPLQRRLHQLRHLRFPAERPEGAGVLAGLRRYPRLVGFDPRPGCLRARITTRR